MGALPSAAIPSLCLCFLDGQQRKRVGCFHSTDPCCVAMNIKTIAEKIAITQDLEHLDFAIIEFQGKKMQPSLERALRHRDILRA